MPFKTDLVTTPHKTIWNKSVLVDSLVYQSPLLKKTITVPKGFPTDFASIPRAFQLFIPKVARHRAAAVVHDYLYNKQSRYKTTRKQADKVFLEAMTESGVNWFTRHSMYRAVRLFGGLNYKGGEK